MQLRLRVGHRGNPSGCCASRHGGSARRVRRGAHAVLLLDRAGWHTTGRLVVPKNITLVFLPSRAPELNPVENIWQYLRQNWLP